MECHLLAKHWENRNDNQLEWIQIESELAAPLWANRGIVTKKKKKFLDLNDQHVLSEVVALFEDDPHRCSRCGRRHGGELQPQRLLLGGHHLAFVQLGRERYGVN